MPQDLPEKILETAFTIAELAKAAGLKRGLVDVWAHRGLIVAARYAQTESRQRPLFGFKEVVAAAIVKTLTENLGLGPGASAEIIAIATELSRDDWIKHVLRHGRDKSKIIRAAVAKVHDKWKWELFTSAERIEQPFGPSIAFIVVPVKEIVLDVFDRCGRIQRSGK